MQSAARRATVAAARAGSAAASRPFSVLATFAHDAKAFDTVVYPRKAPGLDYDLNWSLATDSVTTRGEAYRNASVRELVEHAPRGSVKVNKKDGWSVEIVGAAPAPAQGFATDVMAGRQVMDVEEFEAKLRSVRSESLSYAPRLFVEDAAVGSSRLTEVRVRVITDSPVVALHVRALLHRTPLYNPQAFPRTITVYAATLAGPGVSAAEGGSGPYTVVDVDPATKAGTVLAVGNVALASLTEAIAAAAGQLALTGGYRSVPGGNKHPGIAAARADGVLSWYMRDGHYYAPAGEPHPDLLPLTGDVIAEADGKGYAAVLGAPAGSVAGPAAAKGRLYAAHNFVWTAEQGVASTWAGVTLPSAAAKGVAVGKGALVAQGGVTASLAGPRAVPHPARMIVVGGSGADAAAKAKSAAGLSDAQAEKLAARLAASKAQVVTVGSAADALKALGL